MLKSVAMRGPEIASSPVLHRLMNQLQYPNHDGLYYIDLETHNLTEGL
jgi:hypothetical protein